MKILLITLCCSLFLLATPSETNNFSIDNGQLIWQKIYDTELSKEQLIKAIITSGNFKNSSVDEGILTAEISELTLDYDGYGFSGVIYPLALYHFKAYTIIDFKEDQYRVTIKSIKLSSIESGNDFSRTGLPLEGFAIKKSTQEFKKGFLKRVSKIMDFTFQKITDFKDIEEKNQW